MAASSACSSSGDTSKVSSSSRATTVTTEPSARGSPSKTTFPSTIFPVATFMFGTLLLARAGNGVSGRNELRAASLGLVDAPLDLDGPSFLHLIVLEKAGNQAVRELRAFFRRKLERLSFQHFELTWHVPSTSGHEQQAPIILVSSTKAPACGIDARPRGLRMNRRIMPPGGFSQRPGLRRSPDRPRTRRAGDQAHPFATE